MRQKLKEEEKEWIELNKIAKEILSSGKDVKKLTNKELNTIIKSLKRKDDKGALPTKKSEMLDLFNRWKERPPPVFEYNSSESSQLMDDAKHSDNEDGHLEITRNANV